VIKKKKTLIIIPTNEFGGAEHLLESIALELSLNNSVLLLYIYSSMPLNFEKTPGLILLSRSSKIWGYIKLIPFLMSNRELDIVISSQVYTNGLLGLLRKLRILKTDRLIVRESTLIFRRFRGGRLLTFKLLYWLGYNFVDLVICSTNLMKMELLKNWPNANNWNIKVQQNPVNIEKLNQLSHDNSFDDYNVEGVFIVGAGRLIKVKGFDVLIVAFDLIKDKYPNLRLLIYK